MVPPSATAVRPKGRRHTITRERALGAPPLPTCRRVLQELFLGESLAYGSRSSPGDQPRGRRADLAGTKLNSRPAAGARRRLGCGVIYAASEYGVNITGITLSDSTSRADARRPTRSHPRCRTTARVAGETLRRDREHSAWSSQTREPDGRSYAQKAAHGSLKTEDGRPLNHGIARLRPNDPEPDRSPSATSSPTPTRCICRA